MRDHDKTGSKENPVKCSGKEGIVAYLNNYYGPNKEGLSYERVRDPEAQIGKLLLYKISYEGLNKPILAYFDIEAPENSVNEKIEGLYTEEEIQLIEKNQKEADTQEAEKNDPDLVNKLGTIEFPINCSDEAGIRHYLDNLYGPKAQKLTYEKKESSTSENGNELQCYEVNYKGLKKPIILYFELKSSFFYTSADNIRGLYNTKGLKKLKRKRTGKIIDYSAQAIAYIIIIAYSITQKTEYLLPTIIVLCILAGISGIGLSIHGTKKK
jgi:hypothetical protein